MGTFVTVAAYAPDEEAGSKAIDEGFATVARIEKLISRFDPGSDVSRLNAAAPGTPVKVSLETLECLTRSVAVSRATHGAFDPTIGPLVTLWKGAGQSGRLPTDEEIAAARGRVSYEAVSIDSTAGTVTLTRPGISIDLSSVGKAYTVGRAADAMRAAGVTAGFVDGGGDIAFIGRNPDGRPWRTGVADPKDESKCIDTLYLADCGVITSGNYNQFQTIAGKRYSHIIDARTGRPAEGPASVTIIASTAAEGAGWSTALSVVGEKGRAAADAAGVEYLMLFVEDGEIRRVASPGMARYEKEEAK